MDQTVSPCEAGISPGAPPFSGAPFLQILKKLQKTP
jgi:hypothetical protein